MSISLVHLLQWIKDENELEFKLRKVKVDEGDYTHVIDLFINNMIYRPTELENLSCYELVSEYELKKINKKKDDENRNDRIKTSTFQLLEEHPSHKHMVMSKRKKTNIHSMYQLCQFNPKYC